MKRKRAHSQFKQNVVFLFDKKNYWIKDFIKPLDFANFKKYQFTFTSSISAIKPGCILFILGYTKKISKKIIDKTLISLVCHESDLPKGRGFAPIQWQIIKENKSVFPICLIKINEKLDSGNIILKRKFTIKKTDLYEKIRRKQALATKKIIKEFLNAFPKYNEVIQVGSASYYRRRTKKDSLINVNKSIAEQFNLLRICNNNEWPAFFSYKNKKYKILIYEE